MTGRMERVEVCCLFFMFLNRFHTVSFDAPPYRQDGWGQGDSPTPQARITRLQDPALNLALALAAAMAPILVLDLLA